MGDFKLNDTTGWLTEPTPAPIIHQINSGSTSSTYYYGFALTNVPTANAEWKIIKQTIVSDGSGGTITTMSAPIQTNSGDTINYLRADYGYKFVWDNRLSYTYKR
jgi:hypothetical protein